MIADGVCFLAAWIGDAPRITLVPMAMVPVLLITILVMREMWADSDKESAWNRQMAMRLLHDLLMATRRFATIAIAHPKIASLAHAGRETAVFNFLNVATCLKIDDADLRHLLAHNGIDALHLRDIVDRMELNNTWPTPRPTWAQYVIDFAHAQSGLEPKAVEAFVESLKKNA